MGYQFFDTRSILSNWVFPQSKWLLVNNLRSNNFLCLSGCLFVFITLVVSTQARHFNTWWAQTLVKTLVCLSAPGIFYSWELFVLWHCLESATETSVHSSNIFLFKRILVWAFKLTIYYVIYKIKGNIGITFSHWIVHTFKIDLAISFTSAVENSLGLYFLVYTLIMFLSIGRMTSFLNNDH